MEHSSDEESPNVGKGSGAPRASYPANGYREDGLSRGQVLWRKSCHGAKEKCLAKSIYNHNLIMLNNALWDKPKENYGSNYKGSH